MVRTPCFHCRAWVQPLAGELITQARPQAPSPHPQKSATTECLNFYILQSFLPKIAYSLFLNSCFYFGRLVLPSNIFKAKKKNISQRKSHHLCIFKILMQMVNKQKSNDIWTEGSESPESFTHLWSTDIGQRCPDNSVGKNSFFIKWCWSN